VDPSIVLRKPSEPVLGRLASAATRLLPGVGLSATLALGAMRLGKVGWLQAHGLGALTVSIVLGAVFGNTFYRYLPANSGAGVAFSRQTLLRAGVILYGLRLTLHDVGQVGLTGALTDALLLVSTFALALVLGTRAFGLDRQTSMLIGAGNAICGAAAVMATEPLLRARPEQVTVAVSTVVVFGTAAIFVYPLLYDLNLHWQVLPAGFRAFGIYAGSTIHEVAQVFAAGRSISAETANTAVITKMVRVMMLAPFLIGLSGWLAREGSRPDATRGKADPTARGSIPWFAFAFVGVVVVNSLVPLPRLAVDTAIAVDTFLLAMAMGALGVSTHLGAIAKAGVRPLLLGAVLFLWLVAGGALINSVVAEWLH
jgi:uncharacterized integral membrane protein (TIGR00698 family)